MFASREEAGRQLAYKLKDTVTEGVVVGIARGGVVVAKEISIALKLPLEVLVIKKLGAPQNPELAIGALAPDGVTYIDSQLIKTVGADKAYIQKEVLKKHIELAKRQQVLRGDRPTVDIGGKNIILTDDGVATGATVIAACMWLKEKSAGRILLALPVVSHETAEKLRSRVDKCVILEEPEGLQAVGEYYEDFREVQDEEIVRILASSFE